MNINIRKCSFVKFRRDLSTCCKKIIPENLKGLSLKCVDIHIGKNSNDYKLKESKTEITLEGANPTAFPITPRMTISVHNYFLRNFFLKKTSLNKSCPLNCILWHETAKNFYSGISRKCCSAVRTSISLLNIHVSEGQCFPGFPLKMSSGFTSCPCSIHTAVRQLPLFSREVKHCCFFSQALLIISSTLSPFRWAQMTCLIFAEFLATKDSVLTSNSPFTFSTYFPSFPSAYIISPIWLL